jgi:hypothetical protein
MYVMCMWAMTSNALTCFQGLIPRKHHQRIVTEPGGSSMNIELTRALCVLATLAGCHGKRCSDAEPDAEVVALDCPTYCSKIQASCTSANAQYLDTAHCMAACASFTVGTSTVADASGNTLGCRIYHSGAPSMTEPATHCAHAGPAGGQITATSPEDCSDGNVCESFCTLQIQACGSLDAPLPGNPRDSTGNPIYQYRNMGHCMMTCAAFDRTHDYSAASAGNSLACRLRHATSAAIAVTPNAQMECRYTGTTPRGPCDGVPTP